MAGITISLKHRFDNGEESSTTTEIGSLTPTDAAVIEQTFLPLVVSALMKIGYYNAVQRDPEFAAKLKVTQDIMGLKSVA